MLPHIHSYPVVQCNPPSWIHLIIITWSTFHGDSVDCISEAKNWHPWRVIFIRGFCYCYCCCFGYLVIWIPLSSLKIVCLVCFCFLFFNHVWVLDLPSPYTICLIMPSWRPIHVMDYTNWFSDIESALRTWNKSHLVMVYNSCS